MRRLSLSSLTVRPCSPVEQIDAAVETGFDATALRLIPRVPSDVDVMSDPGVQRAIERRIAETGLRVLDVETVRVTPQTDVAALAPVLEFAGRLGADWIMANSVRRDDYRAEEEGTVVRRLRELCDAAQSQGMKVMVEFVPFRGIATLEDAVRVVAATGRCTVGIIFDTLHFCRGGGVAQDLVDMDLSMLGGVHLSDAPLVAPSDLSMESRHRRLYPGEGDLPLKELLAVIPRDLPVSVEVPSDANAHLSVVERARRGICAAQRMLATVD